MIICCTCFALATEKTTGNVTEKPSENITESTTKKTSPLIYQSGLYIIQINEFDIKSGYAEVDFWYWVITEGQRVSLDNLELSNGKLEPLTKPVYQQLGNKFYASRRYLAKARCLINIERFPFDRETVYLSFEDGEFTADQMIFKPDIANSGIDPHFKMNDWKGLDVNYFVGMRNYPTSFGYLDIPSGQGSEYSQLSVKIELVRDGTIWQKLFKYFWAVFISVLVGLFSLLIRVGDLDGRFGMAVGSLFANVGCSYLLSEQLPQTPGVSLAELVSYISMGFIMLFLIESIISLALFNRNKGKWSNILDRATFITCAFLYALMWILIV
jgi:hypothetical protein